MPIDLTKVTRIGFSQAFFALCLVLGSIFSPLASAKTLLERFKCESLLHTPGEHVDWQDRQVSFRGSSQTLLIKDRNDSRFFAIGKLYDNTLWMDIIVRAGNQRSRVLRKAETFDLILQYFGDRVKTIAAIWSNLDRRETVDNLNMFNQAITEGKKPEEAALLTWTGRQAMQHGFTKVETVYCNDYSKSDFIQCMFHFHRAN